MIELTSVSARGPAERGRPRPVLAGVSLRADRGVLAIVGAHKDGTTLLFDVIDGGTRPRAGQVLVLERAAGEPRSRSALARVSLDAPLPDGLRVDEVVRLEAELRLATASSAQSHGLGAANASERLAVLGAGGLARRSVASLSFEERRTVALALALTSSADVVLVEEPLALLDPVAPSLVADSLRTKAKTSCVVVTTASTRDAKALGDRLGFLSAGVYTPLGAAESGAGASIRIVVSPVEPADRPRVAALAAALGEDLAVTSLDTSATPQAIALVAAGEDLALLARAVTAAIVASGVDVDLVEPNQPTRPTEPLRSRR